MKVLKNIVQILYIKFKGVQVDVYILYNYQRFTIDVLMLYSTFKGSQVGA